MTLTRGCPDCGSFGGCLPGCPTRPPRTYREAVALRAAEASAEAVQAWREGPGRHIARTWRHITRWDRVPIGGCPAAHLDPGTGCPYGGTCSTLPACRRRALERPA